MDNRIFIAGSSGLLGLHWIQAVKSDGPVYANVHNRSVPLSNVTACSLDLTDESALDRYFAETEISLVVNTAGLTSVEICEADPERASRENVGIAAALAKSAARAQIPMIHISTDHLYDGLGEMYCETDTVSPINVYGRTKAEAEDAVLSAHPGALVLRTNFYGWGPSYKPSFSDWILKRLEGREPLGLFDDAIYTPLSMDRVISCGMELARTKASGIYNVVGDEALSKLDFGIAVAAQFGLPTDQIEAINLGKKPGLVRRPSNLSLSNAKLRDTLGRSIGTIDEQLADLKSSANRSDIREIRAL